MESLPYALQSSTCSVMHSEPRALFCEEFGPSAFVDHPLHRCLDPLHAFSDRKCRLCHVIALS